MNLNQHQLAITSCKRCPRLIPYIQEVAKNKVKRFMDEDYWGKPVPGFGAPDPRVLIIGLAPAAHGANRTGRMFTGDSSGDWLYKALYDTGFCSKTQSVSADDGMKLTDIYITALARCAPPENKPLPLEIANCSSYLQAELDHFKSLQVVICLGGLAFKHYCKMKGYKGLVFAHAAIYKPDNDPVLIASYHPSQQNTNTGKLKWKEWVGIFKTLRKQLA